MGSESSVELVCILRKFSRCSRPLFVRLECEIPIRTTGVINIHVFPERSNHADLFYNALTS
jgi:hypothetical protein